MERQENNVKIYLVNYNLKIKINYNYEISDRQ
jgi:hypothetical protein